MKRVILLLCFIVGAVISSERIASAQLHWDASAQLGIQKRFLGSRANGADDAGFGPIGQITGHVALLPLVHVGGYFGHDISPVGDTARNITFGGLRVKGSIPFVKGSWRSWVFVGFGYAGVYQQSFDTTISKPDPLGGPPTRMSGRVEGAGGSFFDLPFGLGASYKLFKPWELCAELGARAGFGHTGSVYEQGPQLTLPNDAGQNATPAGLDRFGLGLTVGILIDL
jgi:hypothetical protein